MNRPVFASAIVLLSVFLLPSCRDDDSGDSDTAGMVSTDGDTSDAGTGNVDTDTSGTPAPRVVLIIADDFGIDALSSYSDLYVPAAGARDFPVLPVIDGICDEGVRFDTAWATPTCTPTRGSVLTGAYGFRTGLDGVGGSFQIDPTIQTLPRILQALDGFEGANIGKWHLGHAEESGGAMTPNLSGWNHYSGSLANVDDYFDWERVENGVASSQSTYATTVQVNDAIAWWTTRPTDEPSLLWLAFNAPHVPFHEPPEGLYQQASLQSIGQRYDAAVEAMDSELARLLAVIDDDTLVIFLGDNGSPGRVIRAEHASDRAKGSLFQGGVHVPLCARGPTVGNGVHTGLVSSVDLYATIAEVMGVEQLPDGAGPDSISLMPALMDPSVPPLRTTVYTGQTRLGQPGSGFEGGYTVRDEQYKWIGNEDGTEALYDLLADPYEAMDLSSDPDMAAVRDRLRDEALVLRGETSR
ncbi:MAG: arylsulfatase B [Myxococcota bacterium]|jgi:arylsulfatase B